jgi:spermidine synthase
MHVTAVDLDPVVVDLARRYFGLAESDTLEVSRISPLPVIH